MMINTTSIDLLSLICTDTVLKKVAATGGGEHHGPCPFCGGKDRFVVQPNHAGGGRWSCRQCHPHWSDAITYVMKRDALEFKDALVSLGLRDGNLPVWRPQRTKTKSSTAQTPKVNDLKKDYVALNEAAWQQAASEFHLMTLETLDSSVGRVAWDYLLGRGLSEAIIYAHGLGYNPSEYRAQWGSVEVWLPRGIVIPWHVENRYWTVRVRQLDDPTGILLRYGSSKYIQPRGAANGLYVGWGWKSVPIFTQSIVVLTEGEFDALAVRSNVRTFDARLTIAATGSASGARLFRWVSALAVAERVLLAFDSDDAGEAAAQWWLEALGERKACRLCPTRHDVTDMVIAGEDLDRWIRSELAV